MRVKVGQLNNKQILCVHNETDAYFLRKYLCNRRQTGPIWKIFLQKLYRFIVKKVTSGSVSFRAKKLPDSKKVRIRNLNIGGYRVVLCVLPRVCPQIYSYTVHVHTVHRNIIFTWASYQSTRPIGSSL